MSWKARLVWNDEIISVDGENDTEQEAYDAASYDISCLHLGNSMLEMNGEDVDNSDPEIEVWNDDDED